MTQDAEEGKPRPSLVVGIGASAGGLDACRSFLAAVPPDSGMAFVVVMHLDPGHESHISELFAATTAMEVVQVSEKREIEPNRVYVIAPDTALEIHDGLLDPSRPRDPHGHRKPIDALFSSLAEAWRERAAAVVMSGTGNDGSAGLRDVKARGGLCLAQDPETAEYDGMPRNAVQTGVVDEVLQPEEMPKALADFEASGLLPSAAAGEPETSEAFDGILRLLGQSYGVNFRASYKRGTLARRTQRRMGLRRVSSYGDYLDLLRKDAKEVTELYRDVLIGVTQFFRNPEVWDRLEKSVLPDLLKAHDERVPVKVWVAGCATGEEAYSLAIVFLEQIERLGRTVKLQVFASDVADDALAFARRGAYPASIRGAVSPERLARFFRREGDGYEIDRGVRDTVTFALHNLLADPPFSQLDLVSCRNVLIYLEPHAQQKILEVFHFALKPGGVLLLGASESIGRHANLFEPVAQKERIFRPTPISEAARLRHLRWPLDRSRSRALPGLAAAAPAGPKVSRVVEQIVLSRYTAACVVVSESFEIQSFFGPTADYLVQPTGEARMDLLAWTKPGLYPMLRAGLEKARETRERVRVPNLRMDRDGTILRVECTIEPITPVVGEPPLFLVSFRDVPAAPAAAVEVPAEADEPLVRRLEAELKGAREEMQGAVEQLERTEEEYRASHEELMSLNEELQSNNEELEASKEELQSLNEEMITVNKQLEEKNDELRTAYADLNNLVVSTRIPIIFLSRDLRVRRYTPAATELMSLTPTDIGRPLDHIKERFRDGNLPAEARKVLETLSPIHGEVRTDDGRWFAQTVVPYRTEDDRIDGVCVAFHDITERKEAIRQVEEARRYAEAIVRTVPTPLLVLDAGLRVRSANDAFYETFRVSAPETEGHLVYELGNSQWDIPKLRELLEEILPRKKSVMNFEVEHAFERIGLRVMRLNAFRMERSDGADLILVAVEDVTEQREAAHATERRAGELVQENIRKNEFLAMLGHELRNPLAAMMHGLDLLDLAPADPARGEEVRAMMRRQSRRIASMLDQLLDIARLTSGKIRIARVPVSLKEAAQAAVEAVMPLAQARRHQLAVNLPEQDVFVRGDLARLTQVVENLLSNAAKYTDEGGTIELTLSADEERARLRVRDTGMGIEAELLPHIFDLFTQAPQALERSPGGLGLGLPLVKRVVEMHGGTVEASSPGRGRGAEFVVTLPRIRERRRPGGGATAPGKPLRILVVDDEKDTAAALAEILAQQGHETRAALDGPAALEIAREFRPEVVLLDLGLPGMDGYEVANRIRRETRDGEPLLVAITGYPEDPERMRKAGIDRHLVKPPDMRKLAQWLAEIEKPAGPPA